MLTEYRLRHNLDVGMMNRLGKRHESHYDPWLVQHIDLLRKKVGIEDNHHQVKHLAIEINALHYHGSKEVYGICPMPTIEMEKIGIVKANEESASVEHDFTIPILKDTVFLKIKSILRPKNARYIYVAKMQCSKFAVIAVHTLEENFLFNRLLADLRNSNAGSNKSNVISIAYEALFALKWNSFANGDCIFYKTPEHIEKYYNQWKEQETARKTHTIHIISYLFFKKL